MDKKSSTDVEPKGVNDSRFNTSSLFSFSQEEVSQTFKEARLIKKKDGLKLLQTPLKLDNSLPEESNSKEALHGKLLIVTPRKFGKAHERNLIRRRIKSIFYQEKLYLIPVKSVLLLYRSAQRYSFQEIKDFLVSAFNRKNNGS